MWGMREDDIRPDLADQVYELETSVWIIRKHLTVP
jgi:hypothetical protein